MWGLQDRGPPVLLKTVQPDRRSSETMQAAHSPAPAQTKRESRVGQGMT